MNVVGMQYHRFNPYEHPRTTYAHQQPAAYQQNIVYVPVPEGDPGHGATSGDTAVDQSSEASQSTRPP